MKSRLTALLLAIAFQPTAWSQTIADPPGTAEQTTKTEEFLRITRSQDGSPKTMDTAIVSYRATGSNGVQVDLIGAVHIGEATYYQQLNTAFETYDVLLYELVAPEGTVIPRGGKRDGATNPVSWLQDSAKNFLGLESQLEKIDYTKPHFVRADMTPTQISNKMAERGDTAVTLALSTLADVLRQQNIAARQSGNSTSVPAEMNLLEMLEKPHQVKLMLAEQFANTGSLDQALGGPLNQLLVVDRNGEALRVLQKQIAAGKKKIGIFYGAAHLPDLEQHLINDFGLEKKETRWLAAWDLTSTTGNPVEPVSLLLNFLKELE